MVPVLRFVGNVFCPSTHCCGFFRGPLQLWEPEARWQAWWPCFSAWVGSCQTAVAVPLSFLPAQVTGFSCNASNHSHRSAHCGPLLVLAEGSARGDLILPLPRPAATRLPPGTVSALLPPHSPHSVSVHGSLICASVLSSIFILKLVTVQIVVTSRERSRGPLVPRFL